MVVVYGNSDHIWHFANIFENILFMAKGDYRWVIKRLTCDCVDKSAILYFWSQVPIKGPCPIAQNDQLYNRLHRMFYAIYFSKNKDARAQAMGYLNQTIWIKMFINYPQGKF